MNQGYIRLHRTLLDNPIVTKDSDYFTIWVHLLLNATHKSIEIDHLGKRFTLTRGQLVTGRKTIAEKYNINESKVQRILKRFESEHQIEQQTNNKNRIITVLNYDKYQFSEQQEEQPVNNQRTTSEQQVNTNNNVLNVSNALNDSKKEPIPFSKIMDYLNQKANKSWKHTSSVYQKNVKARFNEGFIYEDFIKAIDNAYNHWSKSGNYENMHPKTLFNTDFERRVTNDAYASFNDKKQKSKAQELEERGELPVYGRI